MKRQLLLVNKLTHAISQIGSSLALHVGRHTNVIFQRKTITNFTVGMTRYQVIRLFSGKKATKRFIFYRQRDDTQRFSFKTSAIAMVHSISKTQRGDQLCVGNFRPRPSALKLLLKVRRLVSWFWLVDSCFIHPLGDKRAASIWRIEFPTQNEDSSFNWEGQCVGEGGCSKLLKATTALSSPGAPAQS